MNNYYVGHTDRKSFLFNQAPLYSMPSYLGYVYLVLSNCEKESTLSLSCLLLFYPVLRVSDSPYSSSQVDFFFFFTPHSQN